MQSIFYKISSSKVYAKLHWKSLHLDNSIGLIFYYTYIINIVFEINVI